MYGTTHERVPAYRGMALKDYIKDYNRRMNVGYSTNTGATVTALTAGRNYDRVIVVTDEQAHDSMSQPANTGYIINVGTYEPSIAYGKWTSITGWSNNVVKYIAKCES
jgi:hypothetical protein